MQTAAYNKIGMSNAIKYDLLTVAIDHNMSQSAADSVIALVKQAIDSVESRKKARCMPSSMVKFYNTLDDTLAGNNSPDTGIKLKTAKVPLQNLPCYRDND